MPRCACFADRGGETCASLAQCKHVLLAARGCWQSGTAWHSVLAAVVSRAELNDSIPELYCSAAVQAWDALAAQSMAAGRESAGKAFISRAERRWNRSNLTGPS